MTTPAATWSGPRPRRGEVWWVDFSPSIGREIRDEHPALVVSVDQINQSPWGLILVVPISERPSGASLRIHVAVDPPEANLRKPSRIKCDQISKADLRRFRAKLGEVSPLTLKKAENVMRLILGP